MNGLKSLVLITPIVLSGCASMLGHGVTQIYDGPAKEKNEIAILESHPSNGFGLGSGVYIEEIDGKPLSFFAKTQLQLLPGTHQITAACNTDRKGTMAGNSAGLYTIRVMLEAGKHYFVGGNLKRLPRSDWKQIPSYNPLTKQIIGYDTIASECRLTLGV